MVVVKQVSFMLGKFRQVCSHFAWLEYGPYYQVQGDNPITQVRKLEEKGHLWVPRDPIAQAMNKDDNMTLSKS